MAFAYGHIKLVKSLTHEVLVATVVFAIEQFSLMSALLQQLQLPMEFILGQNCGESSSFVSNGDAADIARPASSYPHLPNKDEHKKNKNHSSGFK